MTAEKILPSADLIERLNETARFHTARARAIKAFDPGEAYRGFELRAFADEAMEAAAALAAKDTEISEMREALAFADKQSAKVEALLEPHITWVNPAPNAAVSGPLCLQCQGAGSARGVYGSCEYCKGAGVEAKS